MKILLSGANFVNKGAEAMLFIAANECFNRCTGVECIVQLPEGFTIVHTMDEVYKLSIAASRIKEGKTSKSSFSHKVRKIKTLINAAKEADIMLDMSGYELSSKLGAYPSLRFLFKIYLCKIFKTQVYLMPQSFGPFDYQGIWSLIMPVVIRACLKYPQICFAREKEGVEFIKRIAPLSNLELSDDLVLQNKNIEKIKNQYYSMDFPIADNSVGVIPNRRLIEQVSENVTMACFCAAVEQIRKRGRTVYIISHAEDDKSLCDKIKQNFCNDSGVIVVPKTLSSFEFQKLAAKFQYVVASRFHSIVHSYKEGTPAVALGWAVKYKELLGKFDQQDYLVEVKSGAEKEIRKAICKLDDSCGNQRNKIKRRLLEIQKNNCFDRIDFKEK